MINLIIAYNFNKIPQANNGVEKGKLIIFKNAPIITSTKPVAKT